MELNSGFVSAGTASGITTVIWWQASLEGQDSFPLTHVLTRSIPAAEWLLYVKAQRSLPTHSTLWMGASTKLLLIQALG